MLEGIDEKMARARPIANGHTIAEVTAHATTWMEVVRERLAGRRPEVAPERDFPPVDGITWPELLARLDRAHSGLLDAAARMDDADFEKIVPGKDYTAAYMLDGLIQHNVYHAADRTVEETGIPAVRSSGLVVDSDRSDARAASRLSGMYTLRTRSAPFPRNTLNQFQKMRSFPCSPAGDRR